MNLEDILLSEISQLQKDNAWPHILHKVSKTVKFIESVEWWLPEAKEKEK
jgi:hypothetical protein